MTADRDRYRRLSGGRHRLSREEVAEDQRRRLVGAAGDILTERGIGGLSARLIAHRAGVSNHTFYEHFSGVDAVVRAGFAVAAELLVEVVAGACTGGHDDCDMRRSLAAALALGVTEPGLAALMRFEVAVALPPVTEEREQLARRLAGMIGEARADAGDGIPTDAGHLAIEAALGVGLEHLAKEEPLDTDHLGAELSALFV